VTRCSTRDSDASDPSGIAPMPMISSEAGQLPAFNIIQPTPPRSYKLHYRLLYRGSLSLPDSDLTLDGIDELLLRCPQTYIFSRDHIRSASAAYFSHVTLGISIGLSSRIHARPTQSALRIHHKPISRALRVHRRHQHVSSNYLLQTTSHAAKGTSTRVLSCPVASSRTCFAPTI
jgi:hypothetical protein